MTLWQVLWGAVAVVLLVFAIWQIAIIFTNHFRHGGWILFRFLIYILLPLFLLGLILFLNIPIIVEVTA